MPKLFDEADIRRSEEIIRIVIEEASRPLPRCTHVNFEKYLMDVHVKEYDRPTRFIPNACEHFRNHIIERKSDSFCPDCVYCLECKEILCESFCLKNHFLKTEHCIFIYFREGKKLYCAKCARYHPLQPLMSRNDDLKAWIYNIDINYGNATNDYIEQLKAAYPEEDLNKPLSPEKFPRDILKYFKGLTIQDMDSEESIKQRALIKEKFEKVQPIGIVNVNKSCHTSCLIQVLMHLDKMNFDLFRVSCTMKVMNKDELQTKLTIPEDSLLTSLVAVLKNYAELSEKQQKNTEGNVKPELVQPDVLIQSLSKKSRGKMCLNEEQDFSEVFLFLFKTIEDDYNSLIRKTVEDTHLSKVDKKYYVPEVLQKKYNLDLKLYNWYQYQTVEIRNCTECKSEARKKTTEPGTMILIFEIGMSMEIAIMSTLKEKSVLVSCPKCNKELCSEKKLNFITLPKYLFVQLVTGYNEKCDDIMKINIEEVNLTNESGEVIKYKIKMVVCYMAGDVPHYFCFKFMSKNKVCLMNDQEIQNNLSYKRNKGSIINFGCIYIYEKSEN